VYRSAAALLAAGGVFAGYGVTTGSATTGPDPHVVVKVSLRDGRIVLAKHAVHDVTYVDFLVHNAGKLSHNFRIGGISTAALRPGQTVHLLVAFPAYDRYQYRCTVHATQKMTGWFEVARPLPPG
jgi:hypothetical protein